MSLLSGRSRRWTALAVAVVAFGALAGGVVASQFRGADDAATLHAATQTEAMFKVADIPAAPGSAARGVFVQPTSVGFTCIWDAPSASSPARQGGCNHSDDPFAGRKLFVSLAYDGGPSPADVTDARLIGLAAPEVARVQVEMSDRTTRAIALHRAVVGGETYRAFGYRFRPSDLRRSITPVAVVAVGANGDELDRQTTGIG